MLAYAERLAAIAASALCMIPPGPCPPTPHRQPPPPPSPPPPKPTPHPHLHLAPCSPQHKAEMVRYLRNHQNADGGYGLHIEGTSTMFGTALSYVTLRILGVDAGDRQLEAARVWVSWGVGWAAGAAWGQGGECELPFQQPRLPCATRAAHCRHALLGAVLLGRSKAQPVPPQPSCTRPAACAQMHARGGAHWITSWGKFWLAVLGVYSWDGLNPMPPEMWLLPYSAWTGIGWAHPGRFWCHCRMVRDAVHPALGLQAGGLSIKARWGSGCLRCSGVEPAGAQQGPPAQPGRWKAAPATSSSPP